MGEGGGDYQKGFPLGGILRKTREVKKRCSTLSLPCRISLRETFSPMALPTRNKLIGLEQGAELGWKNPEATKGIPTGDLLRLLC